MIFRSNSVGRALIVVVLAVSGLSGCATGYVPGGAPEAVVKERAQARWQTLIKGDYEGAYKMTPPSYRAVYSLEQFRSRFGGAVKWVAAEVVSAECEPERCTVVVDVSVRPMTRGRPGATVSTGVDEKWVKEDGQWWFTQR